MHPENEKAPERSSRAGFRVVEISGIEPLFFCLPEGAQKKHRNSCYGAFLRPFSQTKNSGSIPLISTSIFAVGSCQRLFYELNKQTTAVRSRLSPPSFILATLLRGLWFFSRLQSNKKQRFDPAYLHQTKTRSGTTFWGFFVLWVRLFKCLTL